MADPRSACPTAFASVLVFLAATAHADAGAAQACAANPPKDAKAIFAATRDLAADNRIDRATARPSALSAAQCLRLAAP